MIRFNKTGWEILNELSKGNKTLTELAKHLKITLPSVHAQIKELEREKLVKKVGERRGKTRPYAEYSIGKGFVYFIKVLPNETEQRFLEVDQDLKVHLRIWSVPQTEYHQYIEKFWWQIQNHLEDIDSIIVYGSVARGDARGGSDIDILILAKKNVKKYEKKFSVLRIRSKDKHKIIMTQVFRTEDFENSLKKGSDFATEVLKSSIVIYDFEDRFMKLKNES